MESVATLARPRCLVFRIVPCCFLQPKIHQTRSSPMIKADWRNSSGGLSVVFVLTALTTPMIFAAPTQAADYDAGAIHITQPWARATPKGASSGTAYMTI